MPPYAVLLFNLLLRLFCLKYKDSPLTPLAVRAMRCIQFCRLSDVYSGISEEEKTALKQKLTAEFSEPVAQVSQ